MHEAIMLKENRQMWSAKTSHDGMKRHAAAEQVTLSAAEDS